MAGPLLGELLREWRVRRGYSQLALSGEVAISTRHLSFVETGRAKPSPEVILAIAEFLDVPLRERNALLLAGGYAPRYSARPLDDPAMRTITASLQRMLDAHDPYPGVVIDRQWDVLLANDTARMLTAGLPAALLEPLNVFRLCLHPEGLAAATVNFEEWAAHLLRQLRRSVAISGDRQLEALQAEVLGYPNVRALDAATAPPESDEPPLLVPFRLALGEVELSFFTTLTVFGTPRDVTLEELAVELFFPADDVTASMLNRELAAS